MHKEDLPARRSFAQDTGVDKTNISSNNKRTHENKHIQQTYTTTICT